MHDNMISAVLDVWHGSPYTIL